MGTHWRTWLNLGFSLALHAAVLLLLGLGFVFSSAPAPTPNPGIIRAVAVNEQKAPVEPDKRSSDNAQEIVPAADPQQLKQQQNQEQQKLAELKKHREQLQRQQEQMAAQRKAEQQDLAKLKEQRIKEEQQLAELRKQQAKAQAEEQHRLEQQKKQQAEAERKRQAEQQRLAKLEKQQQAERRKAAEAAQQAALEKEMAKEAAAREYAQKVAVAKSDYIPAIQRNIAQNWLRPIGTPQGLSCIIHVRMGAGGIVLNAQVVQSSGNAAFDRSAEVAVRKASPLPVPSDPQVASAFRDLNLEFQPSS